MYCNKCGTYLYDDHQFCINCGDPRPVPPPTKKGTLWIPILILVLMFALGCFIYYVSFACPPVDGVGLYVKSGSLRFDEDTYEGSSDLIVPEMIDGAPVYVVEPYCFDACDSITSVTLPGTVRTIDPYAFFDCENLQSVRLSEGTVKIANNAFFSCGSLETIHIPGSLECIEDDAFQNCARLKHIHFNGTEDDWAALFFGEISPDVQIHYASGV